MSGMKNNDLWKTKNCNWMLSVQTRAIESYITGTGNNNKINWALDDPQEMIDIIETIYRGSRKGRGLVISPKDYSTKYRYWPNSCFALSATNINKLMSINFKFFSVAEDEDVTKYICNFQNVF